MTAKLYNLARMTTATTGTGTITLGSAVSGFLTFATAGVADGDVVSYGIKDGSNSEVGTGTYTASGTTLTRTVTKSTNSGSAINLSGTAEVYITLRAEDVNSLQSQGGFRNKFRNPGCDVDQRGTAGVALTVTTSGGYVVDGWIVVPTGASCTAQQAAAQSGMLSANSLKLIGAASVTDILAKQRIEGSLAAPLAGQLCTVQAKIYNNTGGSITPTLTVKHANALDNWSASTTDVSAVSLQACPNAATTTVAYWLTASATSGNGLEVGFDLGNNFSTNGKTAQLSDFDISYTPGVVAGATNPNPQPPELRPIAIELAFCQRYYEPNVYLSVQQGFSTTILQATGYWKAAKRTTPTVTFGSASGTMDAKFNTQNGVITTSAGAMSFDTNTFTPSFQLSASMGNWWACYATAAAEL
jgi:hypothetical protein